MRDRAQLTKRHDRTTKASYDASRDFLSLNGLSRRAPRVSRKCRASMKYRSCANAVNVQKPQLYAQNDVFSWIHTEIACSGTEHQIEVTKFIWDNSAIGQMSGITSQLKTPDASLLL